MLLSVKVDVASNWPPFRVKLPAVTDPGTVPRLLSLLILSVPPVIVVVPVYVFAPLSVSMPLPILVSDPAPLKAPAYTDATLLFPRVSATAAEVLLTRAKPLLPANPLRVAEVKLPNEKPLLGTVNVLFCKASVCPSVKPPPVRLVVPLKVFAPLSVSVPAPTFIKDPAPLNTPEYVVFVLLFPTLNATAAEVLLVSAKPLLPDNPPRVAAVRLPNENPTLGTVKVLFCKALPYPRTRVPLRMLVDPLNVLLMPLVAFCAV